MCWICIWMSVLTFGIIFSLAISSNIRHFGVEIISELTVCRTLRGSRIPHVRRTKEWIDDKSYVAIQTCLRNIPECSPTDWICCSGSDFGRKPIEPHVNTFRLYFRCTLLIAYEEKDFDWMTARFDGGRSENWQYVEHFGLFLCVKCLPLT